MDQVLLSIDCGTQSLRALIFSPDGTLLAKEQVPYSPGDAPRPGWSEKDPLEYWQAMVTALGRLKAQSPDLFSQICAMGVTTIRDTVVCLDKRGNNLRPAILWMDQRQSEAVYRPSMLQRLGAKIVGMDEAVTRIQMEGKCNWIRQNQPDIWARTAVFGMISTWFHFMLTGKFIDSTANQIGHIPFNYAKGRWSRKGELTARLFPVESSKLVDLVPPGTPIGVITPAASEATGLPRGLMVVATASDKGCETLGAGVTDLSMAALSFGTTATIQSTSDKYFEPISYMPAYPAPIPGHFNPSIEIFRGFWMISWFKNEFAHAEVEAARLEGIPPETLMDRWLHEVPPGSLGLIVQPYWGAGLKEPCAKGSIIGFGDAHGKPHLYRAVLEGLGYALYEGLHHIEAKGKVKVRECVACGGGSQSDEVCQMTADIFNRPVLRGRTFETAGLGAAMVTAKGCGMYPGIREAASGMSAITVRFEPNPEHALLYHELFTNVYRKLYLSLKPLYETIRRVTGYPPPVE
ncbi:FGGY-family carbohydrate kinase [Myxococcota bacterium]|nr:FGGY-family carbohydrate kinase [Myxococcota bacterium]MBU1535265.1 FGGY-family carbohydrate kinase [Myxococcota bacterium]